MELSVSDLYEAYTNGRITRGAFIRRLVGFGMTVPVATAYAAALARPGAARAEGYGDLYSDLYGYGDLYDLYDLYNHPGPTP